MTEILRQAAVLQLQAGIMVLLLFVLRIFLHRAPKKYICLLWLLVFVRLLCPVLPETSFRLMPIYETAYGGNVFGFYDTGVFMRKGKESRCVYSGFINRSTPVLFDGALYFTADTQFQYYALDYADNGTIELDLDAGKARAVYDDHNSTVEDFYLTKEDGAVCLHVKSYGSDFYDDIPLPP